MDFLELGKMGRGCEDENCSLTSGLPESCPNPECQLEEHVFGLIELVLVTVVYIPLMLFGLLGNILTILVFWLRPDMRSSTYLYLSSMAVSDLLILLLLPLDLYKLWRPTPWPLGDLACKLTMFLSECCTFCTILHITFFSLERYLAVCWPITAKTLVTRRRTRAVIGCLWLGAAVIAAPVLVMVGVEEVGGEEQGLGEWREGEWWTGRDGEHGGYVIGEREDGRVTSKSVALEEIKWEEEKRVWGEIERERKLGTGEREGEEREQEDEEEGKMSVEGEENNIKEDEGEGREEHVDGSPRGHTDRRECRCLEYAVSSGLLKAMMIVSNLYFLVALCILGLVYSLIGRTLWLRPHSSRGHQSHRHAVKRLGVIVLAFVLCWLPFHVGRTIFSLSLGSDIQETHTDTNALLDSLSNANRRTFTENPVKRSDSETHFKTAEPSAHTHTQTDEVVSRMDTNTETRANMDTQSDVMSSDQHSHVGPHTAEQHTSTDISTHYTPDHTPPTANTPAVTIHTDNDNTQNVTPFDNTPAHSDTHLYLLYYLSQYFNLASSVLFYLSAAVNPLLYNLMSARYRHAVHSLMRTHSDPQPQTHSHTQSRHLATLMVRHSTTTV